MKVKKKTAPLCYNFAPSQEGGLKFYRAGNFFAYCAHLKILILSAKVHNITILRKFAFARTGAVKTISKKIFLDSWWHRINKLSRILLYSLFHGSQPITIVQFRRIFVIHLVN